MKFLKSNAVIPKVIMLLIIVTIFTTTMTYVVYEYGQGCFSKRGCSEQISK